MRRIENLSAMVLALLLVACGVGSYLTRDMTSNRPARSSRTSLVDDRLVQTARQMASIAETREEQNLARDALRLSDHELDQAFASALRDAMAPGVPVSGPLKQLTDRVNQLKAQVAAEKERIAKLAGEQLELARAQLELDEDSLEDAQQDLARQGGDKHSRLERALQEHQALQQQPTELPKVSAAGPATTLSEQVSLAFSLRDRQRQLEAARQQASDKASRLDRAHDTLEKLMNNQSVPEEATATMVAHLRGLSDQRKTLTAFDKRIQDCQQLADVYKQWSAVEQTRMRGALHLLLGSLAVVLAILLVGIGLDKAIHRAFGRQTDRRRLHQLRVIASIAVQVVGVLLILFVVFGMPTQTSTIIGLATAGLTIALKDFIVAFFGWFVLLGRNGIRVGDWVEINGVGGEVIEIGILRTVLLEMGNQANVGHPTGRRVAFMNGFAIEGHYFNFSTAGQWLWDELQVDLPATGDPYKLTQEIRQTVEHEVEAEAAAAEEDWKRVTHQYGDRPFVGKPSVDLRPSGNGLAVVVRYITRAPQQHEVKSRLFAAIIEITENSRATPS